MSLRRILPHRDLKPLLLSVEKPGRYVGGEFGAVSQKPADDDFLICTVFPDLYEIGMSNQALRILYGIFNSTEGLHAERCFSPAPDFSRALRDANRSLYSLENAMDMVDFDLLAVTVGYELSMTNLLEFLDLSRIPVLKRSRQDGHPLVLLGGPAVTNPIPWSDFVDAIFIGEAENHVANCMLELRNAQMEGAPREELTARLVRMDGFWTPGNSARRVVWMGFGQEETAPAALPIPSLSPVQDHGVVEIMRGCPNKCRFCHAGVFYRPFRQKSFKRILEEVEYLVSRCGYRDITLSSLSTGDYKGLELLLERLNRLYSARHVSFNLPSLRINSVTLPLLNRISAVKKSGLTFAVETPNPDRQRGINKDVSVDRIVEILKAARKQGWRGAKFYFMLGLPGNSGKREASEIVDYLVKVQRATGMRLKAAVGTFIPKPHTPFEQAAQLSDAEAMERIKIIRDGLRSHRSIRVTYHSPFISFLEGLLSRGDERAGSLALEAWKRGAGFDAWDDLFNKEAWDGALDSADWNVEKEICRSRSNEEERPWGDVDLGISRAHWEKENRRGRVGEWTAPCAPICPDHCGVCRAQRRVVVPDVETEDPDEQFIAVEPPRRLIVRFRKFGPAIYLGHLDVVRVFEKSLQRAGLNLDFTRGHNPKPRMDFAQPLSLGVSSADEIFSVWIQDSRTSSEDLRQRANAVLPGGFRIVQTWWAVAVPQGRKTHKLMARFWGSDWIIRPWNASFNLQRMAGMLDTACREGGIEDCRILGIRSGCGIIRLPQSSTRGFMQILRNSLATAAGGWDIVRRRSWARGSAGEMAEYDEVFPEHPEVNQAAPR